jgi:multidrug efflux pump subunit AcrA (membrane-fusion protein)
MIYSDPQSNPRTRERFLFSHFSSLGIGFLLIVMAISCTAESKVTEKKRPGLPVKVATAIQKDVPVELRAIGNVEAYSAVSIKALVSGELAKVNFTEGQDVKKGDLLMSIDPRPFEAALRQTEANLGSIMAQVQQVQANLARDLAQVKQAEANLARDMAQAKYAAENAQRYESLVEKNYVAKAPDECRGFCGDRPGGQGRRGQCPGHLAGR